MARNYPTFNAGKIGQQQYYWVVMPPDAGRLEKSDDPLAEGFAATADEAWSTAWKASIDLGLRAKKGYATTAVNFHYSHRGGKEAAQARKRTPKPKDTSETATFLGSPYLWRHARWTDDMTGEYESSWIKHAVVRVTDKSVFILSHASGHRDPTDTYKRLDRAALERDGHAANKSNHRSERDYYTEAGKAACIAEMDERKREQAVAQAEADERNRLFLLNNPCAYCGGPADRFGMAHYKACCESCYDVRRARMTGPLINMAGW
jgi:hypothetical protein